MDNFHCSIINQNLLTFTQIYCRTSVVSDSSHTACSEHLYDIAWKCLEMFLHRVCFKEVFMFLNENSWNIFLELVLNWCTRIVNQSDLQVKINKFIPVRSVFKVQTWCLVPYLPQQCLYVRRFCTIFPLTNHVNALILIVDRDHVVQHVFVWLLFVAWMKVTLSLVQQHLFLTLWYSNQARPALLLTVDL